MNKKPIKYSKEINGTDKFNILFTLFIKPAMRALWIASDYPKERCAAKRLISLYPDFDFFYYITEYNEKFNSLLGFASKKMRPELDKKYKEYLNKKEVNKVYILENEPVIDLEFKEKPKAKNLIELLDNM